MHILRHLVVRVFINRLADALKQWISPRWSHYRGFDGTRLKGSETKTSNAVSVARVDCNMSARYDLRIHAARVHHTSIARRGPEALKSQVLVRLDLARDFCQPTTPRRFLSLSSDSAYCSIPVALDLGGTNEPGILNEDRGMPKAMLLVLLPEPESCSFSQSPSHVTKCHAGC